MAKKATAVKTKATKSSAAAPKKTVPSATKSSKAAAKPASKAKVAARSSSVPAKAKTSQAVAAQRKAPPAAETASVTPAKVGKTKKVEKSAKPENQKPKNPAAGVKTNLTKDELVHYRQLLIEKRHEILGDVGTMESEAFKQGSNLSNMPIHMADVGTDNFEQEFTLGLIESERKILRDIQDALRRIEDGTYGICQGTGQPIPKVRLEAVPWAKYSLEYARALESGQVRREAEDSRRDDDDDEE